MITVSTYPVSLFTSCNFPGGGFFLYEHMHAERELSHC